MSNLEWIKVRCGRRRQADAVRGDPDGQASALRALVAKTEAFLEFENSGHGIVCAAMERLVLMLDRHPAPERTVEELWDLIVRLERAREVHRGMAVELEHYRAELGRVLFRRGE